MELHVKYQRQFERISVFFATTIRFVLNALVIIINVALIAGVAKSGYDLLLALHKPLEIILQQMLLDVVFIIALVEITTTIIGYLKDGYVQVRYIVDTVLIIMLNEIVGLWFRHANLQQALGISVIIITLALVRITAITFSPSRHGPD